MVGKLKIKDKTETERYLKIQRSTRYRWLGTE